MTFDKLARQGLWSLVVAGVLWFASAGAMAAQGTGTIRGRVVEAGSLRPLSGVQVRISGTNLGGLTNASGTFSIANIPVGTHRVQAQTIGYGSAERSVTVGVGQTAAVDFTLSQQAVSLEALVVTGTAAQTRAREVGTSISSVSAREIENAPIVNAEQALAGRSPGVTFMQNSGQAGAGATIKIRGTNTITQSASPLIYVDGIRIFNELTVAGPGARAGTSPLQDIPAEDIDRIEIIKGAAATTLYGTEASSGVIQIFTKKGRSGTPVWNAEISTGLNTPGNWGTEGDPTNLFTRCGDPSLLYGLDLSNQYAPTGRGDKVYWQDPTCPADGTWTENGVVQRYNLSVRGGSDVSTYFVSGNYGDNQGTLPTQGSRDGGLRGNFTFTPLEQVQFQLSSAYTRRNTRWINDGNNAAGFGLNVGRGYRGNFRGGKADDCQNVSAQVCTSNGYLFEGDVTTQSDHFTTGLTLLYNPTESFSNRFAVGWDYVDSGNRTIRPFGFLTLRQGYLFDESTNHTKLSLDYAGSLQNNFGRSIASTFSWGAQLFRDDHRWSRVDVENFAGPGDPTLETGSIISNIRDDPYTITTAGFFLQEQLGFRDRLFITAGLRVDGHSAFGENLGLQPYPKLSASYVLSDYEFWPSSWWDTFKLRAAVGESGKAPGAFDRLRTWSPISGDNGQPGFTPNNLGNPDVGPERTRELEGGFDAGFFGGRAGLELTAFQATTYDALVDVTYPPSQGFLAARTENVGEIRNRGLELSTSVVPLQSKNFEWRLRGNLSLMKSEAVNLDDNPDITTSISTGLNSYVREGYPVPTYFGKVVVNADKFEDPIVVTDSAIGPVFPTQLGSIGSTLTFANRLTLDGLLEFQGGHYLQNYTAYQNANRGVWYPCYGIQEKMVRFAETKDASVLSDVTAMDRARCAYVGNANKVSHDANFWIEPADFMKLRSISLTYDIPQNWIRFARNSSITLAGQNLFTWTDYSGNDPEVNDIFDQSGNVVGGGEFGRREYYTAPPQRTFLLTFRVGF